MLKLISIVQLVMIALVMWQARANRAEILKNRELGYGIKEKVDTMWQQRADGVTNKELKP